ncbi:putative cell wall organization and biogenesis-related protein [Dioszegia hungarica]|uniref:Cell wall organization and biogenesis-related protein n=1 Tax=Dioszegia hungarica TaxID=4972 RepID=A0AA38HD08_9TREE|nr:putative cell wall organization and biogenesis-related protein [Dioszegia hungarica]KAI9636656.1 putative cell wall organization and biogenesis-related protein [Dioszegia hungarica]
MSEASSSKSGLYAVADFCLIPMGLPTPSVGPQIAECQRVLEASGLEYKACCIPLAGYGTNVEGPWDAVMAAIGECHRAVHAMGTPRIATDIRIGTRTDKSISSGGNDGKVKRVEEILGAK